ncbi:MAG: pentapeptide repeat-containing protein [Rhodospirillaceae bacterium]|nr:pentapeptide repeat-containing protein [Rhodospirillaceae bacterium]
MTIEPDTDDAQLRSALKLHLSYLNEEAGGVRLDLRESRQSGAVLRNQDLRRAMLSGCNFDRGHLSGSNLSQAHLVGASFRSADLVGANLSAAICRGAAAAADVPFPKGPFAPAFQIYRKASRNSKGRLCCSGKKS